MMGSWPVTRLPSAPSSATPPLSRVSLPSASRLLWTRLRCSLLVHPPSLSHPKTFLVAPGPPLAISNSLGPPSQIAQWCEHLSKRVAKASSLLHAIGKYEDAHGAFTLLRSCTGWAKFLYSCRTVPPTLQPDALAQADADVRDALGRLVGSPLSADDWRLASLGISAGGIGARSAQEHAPRGLHRKPVLTRPPVHSYLARLRRVRSGFRLPAL